MFMKDFHESCGARRSATPVGSGEYRTGECSSAGEIFSGERERSSKRVPLQRAFGITPSPCKGLLWSGRASPAATVPLYRSLAAGEGYRTVTGIELLHTPE